MQNSKINKGSRHNTKDNNNKRKPSSKTTDNFKIFKPNLDSAALHKRLLVKQKSYRKANIDTDSDSDSDSDSSSSSSSSSLSCSSVTFTNDQKSGCKKKKGVDNIHHNIRSKNHSTKNNKEKHTTLELFL